MNQKQNEQHQSMANSTPEIDQPVSLQSAAAKFGINEITLRSWCKRKHIKWERVKIGAKTRCLVRISDVRAYLAKRNPSVVGIVESPPDLPSQAETTTLSQVPAAVPQEPVGTAAPISPLAAPILTCAGQVKSPQNTTKTNSAIPSQNSTTAVPQSTVAAKPAPSHPPASRKRKTKPPCVGSSGLLMHRAKNSMRKFGADELRKLGAWITQRLANKFAPNINTAPPDQLTPAS